MEKAFIPQRTEGYLRQEVGVNYGTSYLQTHKFHVTELQSTSEEMVTEAGWGSRICEPGCRERERHMAKDMPVRKREELRPFIQLVYHVNQVVQAEFEPDRLTLELWLLNQC